MGRRGKGLIWGFKGMGHGVFYGSVETRGGRTR